MTVDELIAKLKELNFKGDYDVKLLIDPTISVSNRPLKVEDLELVSVDGNRPIVYLQNFDDYE